MFCFFDCVSLYSYLKSSLKLHVVSFRLELCIVLKLLPVKSKENYGLFYPGLRFICVKVPIMIIILGNIRSWNSFPKYGAIHYIVAVQSGMKSEFSSDSELRDSDDAEFMIQNGCHVCQH